MDGVSITHGSPSHRIWNYVGSYGPEWNFILLLQSIQIV